MRRDNKADASPLFLRIVTSRQYNQISIIVKKIRLSTPRFLNATNVNTMLAHMRLYLMQLDSGKSLDVPRASHNCFTNITCMYIMTTFAVWYWST